MKRIIIRNRKNQKISVVIDMVNNQNGLAFVMHGLGGNMDQPHIKTIADAFKEKKYSVVRFDTTNTFGESDGLYEHATLTNYYEDLEDVILLAKTQAWYAEPFVLAGHSFGGAATILYAQKYTDRVLALAPIATVLSGKLSAQTAKYKEALDDWQKTGWMLRKSETNPNEIRKLPWSHMEDRMRYDVLANAHVLTMPVLLIVGDKDTATPQEHQTLFYNSLPGRKEIHSIKNAPHTFKDEEHVTELKKIFLQWIDTIKKN